MTRGHAHRIAMILAVVGLGLAAGSFGRADEAADGEPAPIEPETPAAPSEPVQFQYQFTKGQAFHVTLNQLTTAKTEFAGQPVNVTLSQDLECTYTVKDASSSGTLFEVRCDSVKLSGGAAGQTVTYDSEDKSGEAAAKANPLLGMYVGLKGKTGSFRVSPLGIVKDVKGFDKWLPTTPPPSAAGGRAGGKAAGAAMAGGGMAAMAQAFGAGAMTPRVFLARFATVKDKEMKPAETWKAAEAPLVAGPGSMVEKTAWTYADSATTDAAGPDGNAINILAARFAGQSESLVMAAHHKVKGTGKSSVRVDTAHGLPLSDTQEYAADLDMVVPSIPGIGGGGNVKVNQTIEVKTTWKPADAAGAGGRDKPKK